MTRMVKSRWFATESWGELTEEQKEIQLLREKFYQLAIHYVVQSGYPMISASIIQQLYVPMGVGDWKMAPSYDASKEVLERMVEEGILTKATQTMEGMPLFYFYEVVSKEAPFELEASLQEVLSSIQEKLA